MNERQQDWEWLRDFSRKGNQDAFSAVVRRHLDLVYATALRKLENPSAAEEVTQNVFAVLARKAWQFAPDDSLPAWLYRCALLESSSWLRRELRRRRREQTAVELETTMKTPEQEPILLALVPLLDEGLLSLSEKDRTALLLRYYENRPLREVGAALGVSEDAARKRVGTALESVTRFFKRRGIQTATVGATVATLQHTTSAAPATLAAAIAKGTLIAAPPALAGLTGLLSRLAALTKLQTAILCVTVATVPLGWQWQQSQQAQEQQSSIQVALQQNHTEENELKSSLTQLRAESARLDLDLAKAEERRATAQASADEAKALKKRLSGLLTASDYRWPADLPLVRIPKSALKEMLPGSSIHRSGKLEDWAEELLSLTVDERKEAQAAIQSRTEDLAKGAADRACVTNYLPEYVPGHYPVETYKSVWVPPVSPAEPSMNDDFNGNMAEILGEQRFRLLFDGGNPYSDWLGTPRNMQSGRMYTVTLAPKDPEGLVVGQYNDEGGGAQTSDNPHEVALRVPNAIAARFFDPWLLGMGITNTTTKGN